MSSLPFEFDDKPLIDDALRRSIDDIVSGRPTSDKLFDQLFPERIRLVSSRFWTPVAVARKAAKILAMAEGPIVDVGAGVGKFCIIGALTTDKVFHGIEHRPELAKIANGVIDALGLSKRAHVFAGTLEHVDWPKYSAFYFCNPFEENIFPEQRRFDDAIELSRERFQKDTERVEAILDSCIIGSRVVTFHGLGARIPSTFRRVVEETHGNPLLHSWIKVGEGSAEGKGTFDGWIDPR